MWMWLTRRVAARCRRIPERRAPDLVIGEDPATGGSGAYLLRWYLIPRNPFFNIYLHRFLRSDDDRALHDHPWWNLSWLLDGRYLEQRIRAGGVHERRVRRSGSIVLRGARSAHRIELDDGPVWTLFVTGPRLREWGFHCPQGWRHWREFTAGDRGERIGRGCE